MPNGIRLGVAADTREFDTGVKKGIIDPLENASDALRDLAKDGDRAGSDLEKSMRDQQGETKKLEREYRGLADSIKTQSRKAGRDIDDGIGDGLDKAGAGLNDFKDEASSTAREGAASFSGEFSDVGDVVQETLANALGGFGPVGAAAGIAAAVGFGVLTAQIEKDTEASKQRVSDMYDAMIDSQGEFLNETNILDRVQELSKEEGDYSKALEISKQSGETLGVVLRAMAGDKEALAQVNGSLTDKQDELNKSMEEAAENSEVVTFETDKVAAGYSAAKDTLNSYSSEMEKASEKYDAYAEAARYANNQMQDAAAKAAGLREEIVKLPGDKTITLRVDDNITGVTSRFNTALSAMRRQANAGVTIDYQLTKNGTKVY